MEEVALNDAEGLRRRPTRTQSGSRVDEYKRAPDLVQRAPSLRRTKSGTSVASPPEIARVRSFGVALSKRSRKLRRRLRRRYNRAAEAFELLHRAQIEQRRFLMAHPTALWRVLWRFFVFCLLVGRILADARETFAAARLYRRRSRRRSFRLRFDSATPKDLTLAISGGLATDVPDLVRRKDGARL